MYYWLVIVDLAVVLDQELICAAAQYTFEVVGNLLHEYKEAVWDDPIDPIVYIGHVIRWMCGNTQVNQICFADQVQMTTDFHLIV